MDALALLEKKLNTQWQQVQNAKTLEEVRQKRAVAISTYNQLKKQRLMLVAK